MKTVSSDGVRGAFKKLVAWQLTKRYTHDILSLFNIVTCKWNALGSAFLQSSDPVVEELLFSVSQPAICRANNVLVIRKYVRFHEFFQFRKRTEVTWSQDNATAHTSAQALAAVQNAGFELLRHPPYSPLTFILHGKNWLEDQELFFYNGIKPWRNAWPSAIQLQETMLKSDKIWCAYHS